MNARQRRKHHRQVAAISGCAGSVDGIFAVQIARDLAEKLSAEGMITHVRGACVVIYMRQSPAPPVPFTLTIP